MRRDLIVPFEPDCSVGSAAICECFDCELEVKDAF